MYATSHIYPSAVHYNMRVKGQEREITNDRVLQAR